MKWYNHRAFKQHIADMKMFKDENELRHAYSSWVKTISSKFDRSYSRVGVLNLQDLLQEGYIAFYNAWNDLNWEIIGAAAVEERPALITSYLKRRIHDRIKRAIMRDRDTIRIPEGYYVEKPYGINSEHAKYNEIRNTDIFLTRTFASFFEAGDYLDVADDGGDYIADILNDFLNDVMDTYLSKIEKVVIKMFYGIDEAYDKAASQTRISEYCYKSISNIQNIKYRGLEKLKNKDVKEIIENFIEMHVI